MTKPLFTHDQITELGFIPELGDPKNARVYAHKDKDMAWFPCCNVLMVGGRMKVDCTKEKLTKLIKK